MKLTLVQFAPAWHRPTENRRRVEFLLRQQTEATDLLVLPEMWSTGFTMRPAQVAEPMDGPTVKWMQQLARQHDAAVCGSVVIAEEDRFYNRFLFVHPGGRIDHYDKRYLFNPAGEGEVYTAGAPPEVIEYRNWKILPQICYDLRFPENVRDRAGEFDLLLYVASWPETRAHHWRTLLAARAIENQAFCVGVNRVGFDQNNYQYQGDSLLLDPQGVPLLDMARETGTASYSIASAEVQTLRQKLPFLQDRISGTKHPST